MTLEELYQRIGGSYASALMGAMNDEAYLRRMLEKFVAQNYYGYISESYKRRDFKAVNESAKRMKVNAGNLGIIPLYNGAAGIVDRTMYVAPGNFVDLTADLNVLKIDYDSIMANIRTYLMSSY